ncbi:MAG: hypothetical protein U9O87_01355, partial [Verrucomicrobiota bacterium]|nr:hypothetical protein [Verrucomicrobiota bacterium]
MNLSVKYNVFSLVLIFVSLFVYVLSENYLRQTIVAGFKSEKISFDALLDKLPRSIKDKIQIKLQRAALKDRIVEAKTPESKVIAMSSLALLSSTTDNEKMGIYQDILKNYPSLPASSHAYCYFFLKNSSEYQITIKKYQKYAFSIKDDIQKFHVINRGIYHLIKINTNDRKKMQYLKPLLEYDAPLRDYYKLYDILADVARDIGDKDVYNKAQSLSENCLDKKSVEDLLQEIEKMRAQKINKKS